MTPPAAVLIAVTLAAHAAEPLPKGAVQRLGDTRLRPGVRVTHLAFSPDGSKLASWGNWSYFEDRLSVWDTATGREVRTVAAPENRIADLCWGSDGRGYAVLRSTNSPAPVGGRLWAFTDEAVPPLASDERTPQQHALSADGRRLAVARTDGTVAVYDAPAVAAGKMQEPVAARSAANCMGLKFVRDGKAVVILTSETKGEQTAVVWDIEKDIASDPVPVAAGVRQGWRQAFDAADDGSALAVGRADGTVAVYDLPDGRQRLSVRKHDGPARGGKWSEVSAVRFVNGGRNLLTAGRDNHQVVWDARTGADVANLDGHGSWVEAVAVSADGKRVATAGQDSLVRLWDADTWKPVLPPVGPHDTIWRLEVSRDGKHAAAASGNLGHVWELATGKPVRAVPADHRGGYFLFAPDGGLVAGDKDGKLAVYPLPAGDPKPVPVTGRLLDFTPDGATLLTARGPAVVAWDWPAGRERRAFPLTGDPQSAAVSPDGRTAVVGPGPAAVLDLAAGTSAVRGPKLHWFHRAAGFAPGGQVVCGAGGGPRAEAWAVGTGATVRAFDEPPRRPRGHFYVMGLVVSPDGRRAATYHSDGGAAVYETMTGQLLGHFAGHRESVIAAAWVPRGDRLLTAGGDHQVLVWDTSARALAGPVAPLPAADRAAEWDRLGQVSARDAVRLAAALAADPDAGVAFVAARLRPVPATPAATLDRLFRDLDAADFATRDRAARELAGLGDGAVGGVRDRAAATASAEVRDRAAAFLARFDTAAVTPDRVRVARALDVLAAIDTPAARSLVRELANGAAGVWQTDAARQALQAMTAGR